MLSGPLSRPRPDSAGPAGPAPSRQRPSTRTGGDTGPPSLGRPGAVGRVAWPVATAQPGLASWPPPESRGNRGCGGGKRTGTTWGKSGENPQRTRLPSSSRYNAQTSEGFLLVTCFCHKREVAPGAAVIPSQC